MRKLLIIVVLLFIPQIVSASVISMTTTISTDVLTKDSTNIQVKIVNSGDEAAYSVQTSILLPDDFVVNQTPNYVGTLNPNEPKELDFKVSLKNNVYEGTYPLIALVEYTDANGYPFSSVSPSSLIYKTPTLSKISGVMSELSLSGKETKKLTLTVRNLDDVQHNVNIKLFIPRELKVENDETEVVLKSKEEKNLDFEISSFSALPGSSYVVLASMDYDYKNLHYSSIARSVIKIIAGNSSEFPIWIPILTFVGLLIIFIYYLIRGKHASIRGHSNIKRGKESTKSFEGYI